MENYRVFISYSKNDLIYVNGIKKILEENMLKPIYDKYIPGGHQFDEDIKKYITQSHVFMPVITEESWKSEWVHEEIGYAMALNIPILPIARKEQQLTGMLQMYKVIVIDEQLTNAKYELKHDVFYELIRKSEKMSTYICKSQTEQRASLMAEYADDVRKMGGGHVLLRQKGGLSSFQIPNEIISNDIWDKRYYPIPKNDNRCECQLKERCALEEHALEAGCKLIINPSIINKKGYKKTAKIARFNTFLKFLNSIENNKIDVVIDPNLESNESITILGDWFSAESHYRPENQGFQHTMFTKHAPGIIIKKDTFDKEFNTLMEKEGFKPGETRRYVIDIIEKMIVEIERSK